jgi:hypothetical protein
MRAPPETRAGFTTKPPFRGRVALLTYIPALTMMALPPMTRFMSAVLKGSVSEKSLSFEVGQ